MARLHFLVRSIFFSILPPLLPSISSHEDYHFAQMVNQGHFALCLLFIQGFALHKDDVVIAWIIACLAFEGRNQQNKILVNQTESQVGGDLVVGAAMCFLALALLLPSLIVNSYGKHEQEKNAPEVEDEASLSSPRTLRNTEEALQQAIPMTRVKLEFPSVAQNAVEKPVILDLNAAEAPRDEVSSPIQIGDGAPTSRSTPGNL